MCRGRCFFGIVLPDDLRCPQRSSFFLTELQAAKKLQTGSFLFAFHHFTLFFLLLWRFSHSWWQRPHPSSHILLLLSPICIWGQQRWRTQGISHHLWEEANPLCPNFNWATNPAGLSKQWAPSTADNLACPPPFTPLSRAGLGPASVTVSNSGTTRLHRKCELLTKWLVCLQQASAGCHKSVSTNQVTARRDCVVTALVW